VAVGVGEPVAVPVGVAVGEPVAVPVGVAVGEPVTVPVAVAVGVGEPVTVPVGVGEPDTVPVGDAVGVGEPSGPASDGLASPTINPNARIERAAGFVITASLRSRTEEGRTPAPEGEEGPA
jgi:hypothetical protein